MNNNTSPVLEQITSKRKNKKPTPRIVQFGEGNFLRAFVDWMFHHANETDNADLGVTVVQPIEKGMVDVINAQDGLYTLYINGIKNNEAVSEPHLIESIVDGINPYRDFQGYLNLAKNPDWEFVVSNTTEAGIKFDDQDKVDDQPPSSFPAKLTRLLYERFQFFDGDPQKGINMIPCELIERNGEVLKSTIEQYIDLWELENAFKTWITEHCSFCNTLVDRIVPGYPRDKAEKLQQELGYTDQLIVEGEVFHLWVIEGPETIRKKLPLDKYGLNVVFTDDLPKYRTRKVRILNGSHTSMVPVGYLFGLDTVRESVEHEIIGGFIRKAIFEEIIPSIDDDEASLKAFATEVIDRFRNPYIRHLLISISLNSFSKYKTRVMPSLVNYSRKFNALPNRLVIAFSALLYFYKGSRNGQPIDLKDDDRILEKMRKLWDDVEKERRTISYLVEEVVTDHQLWGDALVALPGFKEQVGLYLETIQTKGIKALLDH